MKTKLKDLYKEIKAIKKEVIYNYNYKYYDLKSTPYGDAIIPNEENNEKFGPSRKGYELFKQESEGTSIGYSGEISLREVYIRETNEVIGYITEKKKPLRPYIDASKALYEEIYEEFIIALEVKDEEALKYYLEENGPGYDIYEKDAILLDQRKASYLLELLEAYEEDEYFKHYFDKIVK